MSRAPYVVRVNNNYLSPKKYDVNLWAPIGRGEYMGGGVGKSELSRKAAKVEALRLAGIYGAVLDDRSKERILGKDVPPCDIFSR